MKSLAPLLGSLVITSTICLASFSISDITEWEQLKKGDFDLRFTYTQPSSTIERHLPYYRFTLVAPTTLNGRTGVELGRIDLWKDKRSTEIPIQMHDHLNGMKKAYFSISENDLETSVVVVRYRTPNTSAEIGYRLQLKDLIEKKKTE